MHSNHLAFSFAFSPDQLQADPFSTSSQFQWFVIALPGTSAGPPFSQADWSNPQYQ
jgi:hypothetical protein